MKKYLTAISKWILINGFIAACFYFGITFHNGLAQLAQVITWVVCFLTFAVTLLYCGSSDEAKKLRLELIASRKGTYHIPAWVNLSYDMILAAFLAYHSFVFTGVALLAAFFFMKILHEKLKEEKAKAQTETATS